MANKKKYKFDDLDIVIRVSAKKNGRYVEHTNEIPVEDYFDTRIHTSLQPPVQPKITVWDVVTGKYKEKLSEYRDSVRFYEINDNYEEMKLTAVEAIREELQRKGKLE